MFLHNYFFNRPLPIKIAFIIFASILIYGIYSRLKYKWNIKVRIIEIIDINKLKVKRISFLGYDIDTLNHKIDKANIHNLLKTLLKAIINGEFTIYIDNIKGIFDYQVNNADLYNKIYNTLNNELLGKEAIVNFRKDKIIKVVENEMKLFNNKNEDYNLKNKFLEKGQILINKTFNSTSMMCNFYDVTISNILEYNLTKKMILEYGAFYYKKPRYLKKKKNTTENKEKENINFENLEPSNNLETLSEDLEILDKDNTF